MSNVPIDSVGALFRSMDSGNTDCLEINHNWNFTRTWQARQQAGQHAHGILIQLSKKCEKVHEVRISLQQNNAMETGELCFFYTSLGRALALMPSLYTLRFCLHVRRGYNAMASVLGHAHHIRALHITISMAFNPPLCLDQAISAEHMNLTNVTVRYMCDHEERQPRPSIFHLGLRRLPHLLAYITDCIDHRGKSIPVGSRVEYPELPQTLIHLKMCGLLTPDKVDWLTNTVRNSSHMQTLDTRNCVIENRALDGSSLLTAIKNNTHLQKLSLQCWPDLFLFRKLTQILSPRISSLSLHMDDDRRTNVDECVYDAGLSMVLPTDTVKTMQLTLHQWNSIVARSIKTYLISTNNLTTIEIKTGSQEIPPQEWFVLCDALRKNTSITKLQIFSPPTSQLLLNGLKHFLKINSTLETLVMSSCPPDWCVDKMTQLINFIGDGLRVSVVNLHIPYTVAKTKDDGKLFLKTLSNNYTLENVSITFREQASRYNALKWTLYRLNRAGRRYMLEPGFDKSSCLRLLVSVSDDPECLYYHLRENLSQIIEDKYTNKKRKRS